MDNFVVRTPREPPVRIPSAAPVRHQQQRLTELKRVVRVDDIVEVKARIVFRACSFLMPLCRRWMPDC